MNAFQTCRNVSDAVPLYLPQQLYLKPSARLTISLQLPNVKKLGKSISHWEIMEKLRELIKPEEFSVLKVTKTTTEFVRFEAEIEDKKKLDKVISRLDNRTIKLKDFSELMRLKSAESKSDFPSRHVWDNFFHEAKDMNEMKPGERPDTIHISNLPIKWFVPYHLSEDEDAKPSEKMFHKIFEKFGQIRFVDIPICDPYRSKMKDGISGIKTVDYDDKEFFEGYVQFKDYISFNKAMDFFRGMKLLRKDDDEVKTVNIKVDFDRAKHLSDASIRRREIVRDRLVKKQKEKEEKEQNELEEKKRREQVEKQKEQDLKLQKEQRRRIREEKRKAKILEELKIKGADEINEKIAKEEKKLLKVQRKLEAIRVVEELFRRIKERKEIDVNTYSKEYNSTNSDELKKYKNNSELEVLTQREKLHHAIKGRVMLKSMLSDGKKPRTFSSSSSDSSLSLNRETRPKNWSPAVQHPAEALYDPNWYGNFPPDGYNYHHVPPPSSYPIKGHPVPYLMYNPRIARGGYSRGPYAGPSRGYPRRGRGFKPRFRGGYSGGKVHLSLEEEQYLRYFSKFLHEHDSRGSRSRSRSYSPSSRRSRSRSRRRSYSRSRRSYTRSKSRSRSRSRSRKRTRSASYRSKSRSRSRKRTKSRSERREKSHFTPSPKRRPDKNKSRSRSKSADKLSESRERHRSASIDSSKFISPQRMRNNARSRSKSWSLPKETDNEKGRSWSKSPEKT